MVYLRRRILEFAVAAAVPCLQCTELQQLWLLLCIGAAQHRERMLLALRRSSTTAPQGLRVTWAREL